MPEYLRYCKLTKKRLGVGLGVFGFGIDFAHRSSRHSSVGDHNKSSSGLEYDAVF